MSLYGYWQLVEDFYGFSVKRRIPFPGFVKAKDGWAAVNSLTAQQWESALTLMGMADELADEDIRHDLVKRDLLRPKLETRANEWAKDKTRDEIFYSAQELRIPAGLPYTPPDMLKSPQLLEREFFAKVFQQGLGEFLQPRAGFVAPFLKQEVSPAPALGQHNYEVFRDMGFEMEDIQALGNVGII